MRAEVEGERAQSLEFMKTFVRIARPVLDGGGSVTFEWPRWCDGRKQPEVQVMVKILKPTSVNIDGCAVGMRAEDGTTIMKPWRILVSWGHVGKALEGHLCDRPHAHAWCEGARRSRTTMYPKRLCELIHEGLDAHARSAGSCIGAAGGSIGAVGLGAPACTRDDAGEAGEDMLPFSNHRNVDCGAVFGDGRTLSEPGRFTRQFGALAPSRGDDPVHVGQLEALVPSRVDVPPAREHFGEARATEAGPPEGMTAGSWETLAGSVSALSTGLTWRWLLAALPIARRCSTLKSWKLTVMKATGLTEILVSSASGVHLSRA